jgi:hypothetical protein
MRTTSTRAIQFSLVLGILAFAANYGVPMLRARTPVGSHYLTARAWTDGTRSVNPIGMSRTERLSPTRWRARKPAIW